MESGKFELLAKQVQNNARPVVYIGEFGLRPVAMVFQSQPLNKTIFFKKAINKTN